MKDVTDMDTELDNHSNFVHYSDKLPIFQGELIPIISQSYLTKSESFYILEVLPLNNNSKIVCDQIHLILLLNQL